MRHTLASMVAGLAITMSSTTHAQWINSVVEDAFDGDQQMALTGDPLAGYVFGFRCSTADDLTMIYGTPEVSIGNETEMATLAKMLIIVDDAPIKSFDVKIDTWNTNQLRFHSDDVSVTDVILLAAQAKRRIAVAIEMIGQKFHSRTFKAGGTSRTIGKLIKTCAIKAVADDANADEESPTTVEGPNKL